MKIINSLYSCWEQKVRHAYIMKIAGFKILILLIAILLSFGFSVELTYANKHEDCPCCNNKCHSAASQCHDSVKSCVCVQQSLLQWQFALPKTSNTPELTPFIYFAKPTQLSYSYLFVEDIFHPPKLDLGLNSRIFKRSN